MVKKRLHSLFHKLDGSALAKIAMGFAVIILLGSLLLSLPCAARDGRSIGWFDGLFTSTSAVCVTGLVVRDTGTSFSVFGKIVLVCLIEIGGLGFMTFAAMVLRVLRRNISLTERVLIQESMNESGVGGMAQLIRWVAKSAFAVQAAGAAVLALRFVPAYGWARGAFYAVFHSVSAFCNAGFDLFGNYSSLTGFRADVLINLAVMALVIVGGLGFGVQRDMIARVRGESHLRLQTRIVLAAYGALLLFGWAFVLLAEWNNPETLGALPVGEKLLAALFQSVTLRTAGFNTIDQQALRPITKMISGALMLIGASPASTGGGVKVTTLAVILLSVGATVRGRNNIVVCRRNIPHALVRRALAVLLIAMAIVALDITVISLLQPELEFMDLVMECCSAMGTVGVSAFGSARLNGPARALIIMTMYLGRIGPLTVALLLARRQSALEDKLRFPDGEIMIG